MHHFSLPLSIAKQTKANEIQLLPLFLIESLLPGLADHPRIHHVFWGSAPCFHDLSSINAFLPQNPSGAFAPHSALLIYRSLDSAKVTASSPGPSIYPPSLLPAPQPHPQTTTPPRLALEVITISPSLQQSIP